MVITKLEIVGWCNGSTNVFGTFSFGSSPGPITKCVVGYGSQLVSKTKGEGSIPSLRANSSMV